MSTWDPSREMKGSERKRYLPVRNLPFLYSLETVPFLSQLPIPEKRRKHLHTLLFLAAAACWASSLQKGQQWLACFLVFCFVCIWWMCMCVPRMEEESGILSLCTYAPDRFLRDLESGWPPPSPGSPLASAPYGTGDLGLAMLGFFCGCLGFCAQCFYSLNHHSTPQ